MRPVLRSWTVLFVAAIMFVAGMFWLRARPQGPKVEDPLAEARESLDRGLGLELSSEVAPGGGVRVKGVKPGSPAERAGIKGGDRIVACGDYSVWHAYQLRDLIAERLGQGVPVVVLVDREGDYRPAVLAMPRVRASSTPTPEPEGAQ
jgi:S1-C subfamily serine protease